MTAERFLTGLSLHILPKSCMYHAVVGSHSGPVQPEISRVSSGVE